jgi:hypothetical protein
MRHCNCCALEEIRIALDEKIRSGVSYADLAREYGQYNLSPDAIERHARNHVLRVVSKDEQLDAARVFHQIANDLGELARSAKLTGDLRAAIDALSRQAQAAENYQRVIETRQQDATKSEPVWKPNGDLNPSAPVATMRIEDFDELVKRAQTEIHPTLDFGAQCQVCGQSGKPRGIFELPETPAQ